MTSSTINPESSNTFVSTIRGHTVTGRAHSLSAWFVLSLRLMMGWAFAYSGFTKIVAAEPFDAGGYLEFSAATNGNPLAGLFAWMGSTPWFVEFANVFVPATQLLIGTALILGAFVRLAALGGAMQMMLFYLGGWTGEALALFDSTLVYAMVFLTVAAFGAGRILGLDAYIERLEVGGEALIEKLPALRYLLG